MYISHQKCDHPILESSHKNEAFPSKNISLQTSIVSKAQEHIQARFSMDESSSLRVFQLQKGMVIFISSYLFIYRAILKDLKREKYDQTLSS